MRINPAVLHGPDAPGHPELVRVLRCLGPSGVRAARVPRTRANLRIPLSRRHQLDDVPRFMALPHLTDEPESLRDERGPELRAMGRHALTDHKRFALECMMMRFGRRTRMEPSAGTLPMAPVLAGQCPDARFVHIYRDGWDTAISTGKHTGSLAVAFRLLFDRLKSEAADKKGIVDRGQGTLEPQPCPPVRIAP